MNNSKYFTDLENHIKMVQLAWSAQLRPVLESWGQDPDQLNYITTLIKGHDSTKWSANEFRGYYDYYESDDPDENLESELNKAWLHHQNHNSHHWQYWVVIQDDDAELVPVDMPFECICEMVCDWHSFSAKNPNSTALNYYEAKKDVMILSKYTRTTVEGLVKYLDKPLGDIK